MDPDGGCHDYDVYFGTEPDPPLFAAHQRWDCYNYAYFNQPEALHSLTSYYWRVVARDAGGNEASGPVWSFTTGVNQNPLVPDKPIPPDNAPGFSSSTVDLKWQCGDMDHQPLTYDVYLGTDPSPPLVASHVAGVPYADFYWYTSISSYAAGPFTNGMTYYWKIVAHDPEGGVTEGPVWKFTAGENQAPVFDAAISPVDGATTPVIHKIIWAATDANLDLLTYDLYFGTTNSPALFRHDLTTMEYWPPSGEVLLTGTTYYWYVVADDGHVQTTSPTHTFTTVPPGDVNVDGNIDSLDLPCMKKLVVFGGADCAPTFEERYEARARADVTCDGFITPADARALHKHVLEDYPICSGGTTPAPPPPFPQPSPQGQSSPVVDIRHAWIEWDTLKVELGVSGVPSLKSLGIGVEVAPHRPANYYPAWKMVVSNTGATQNFEPFFQTGEAYTTWNDNLVAGYTLGEVDCTSETKLLELDIYLPQRTFDSVKLSHFVDDLAGAPDVTLLSDNVPVLFSAFTATPRAGGINVAWKLRSDEVMESYTLYRHGGDASAVRVIASGAVSGTAGSYFDSAVVPGTKYHYELAIRTAGGDVFSSPVADATMAALKLALYQNHPNPFNPETTIGYDLPAGSTRVRLRILDVGGHVVCTLVDENQAGGTHSARWNGNDDRGQNVSSGVYFYTLDAGKERLTKKLMLLK
jgi:FlgD Ig-like domain/Dockerin type I domain